MFKNKTTEEHPALDAAIDAALLALQAHDPGSPEYAKITEQLERLYKLKVSAPEPSKPLDVNVVLTVAGNLAGIGLILGYERAHIITTKALGFVLKSKL